LKLKIVENHAFLSNDPPAILAAAAALMLTLATTGSFEARWRANRMAASGMETHIHELARPGADRAKVLTRMAGIHRRLNEAVATGELAASLEDGASQEGATSRPGQVKLPGQA